MVTNIVLQARKQRIEADMVIFEARLEKATQSLEKTGLQSRLDELKTQVASIDSVLNAVTKLNDSEKVKAGGEITTALAIIPVEAPLRKKRTKRGRPMKRKLKAEEVKPLFQV
jgi:hypothetical protein